VIATGNLNTSLENGTPSFLPLLLSMEVGDTAEKVVGYILGDETRNSDFLVVMDVHRKWCGPTTVIHPTLNTLLLDVIDYKHKVALISVSSEELTEWMNDNHVMKKGKNLASLFSPSEKKKVMDEMKNKENTCKSSILFFKVSPLTKSENPVVLSNIIVGVDAVQIPKVFQKLMEEGHFSCPSSEN